MGMDREDRVWLDRKFSEVHEKSNGLKEDLTEQITGLREEFRVHQATPCKDVADHNDKKHNLPKFVAFVASIMGAVLLAYKFLLWLIASANTRP